MARPIAATQLENKYARLMGAYQVIDHEVEPVMGMVGIIEKQLEIERRKRKMLADLQAMAVAIKQFEPDWDSEAVKPILTRPRYRKFGDGAKATYRVLRKATEPMTNWSIAKALVHELGIADLGEGTLQQLASVAYGNCQRGVERGMIERHEGRPIKYSLKQRPRRAAAANSQPSAEIQL
jgi:hypothetical protein